MPSLSRRAFLLGSAAGALALASPALAQFPSGQRFSSVTVDVASLHARGHGPYAEFVRQAVLAETRHAFADRLGGRGPRLVVRITGIYLASYSGGGGRFGGGSSHTDTLEGEALLVGPRGEILARHPQLSATSAASGGPWWDPVGSEHRRVTNLAQHYAGWLRRSLG